MKIFILVASILGTGLLTLRGNAVDLYLCEAIDTSCRLFYANVWQVSPFFPLVLLFSLATFSLPQQAFKNWGKFLLVWGPLTILITTLVHLEYFHSDGGFMNMDTAVDTTIIYTVYIIFILGSIISILRGYSTDKQQPTVVNKKRK